jgi:hypothetical protein
MASLFKTQRLADQRLIYRLRLLVANRVLMNGGSPEWHGIKVIFVEIVSRKAR